MPNLDFAHGYHILRTPGLCPFTRNVCLGFIPASNSKVFALTGVYSAIRKAFAVSCSRAGVFAFACDLVAGTAAFDVLEAVGASLSGE